MRVFRRLAILLNCTKVVPKAGWACTRTKAKRLLSRTLGSGLQVSVVDMTQKCRIASPPGSEILPCLSCDMSTRCALHEVGTGVCLTNRVRKSLRLLAIEWNWFFLTCHTLILNTSLRSHSAYTRELGFLECHEDTRLRNGFLCA